MKKLKLLSLILVIMAGVMCFSACEFSLFGNQYLEVKSDSMAPAMKTGDMVVVKEKEEYGNGDIIVFVHGQNITVCHRIIFTFIDNQDVFYICKGDNVQNLDGTKADGKWNDDARYIENLVYGGATLSDIVKDYGMLIQVVEKDQIQGEVINIIKK